MEVFRRFHGAFLAKYGHTLNPLQRHLLQSILQCRTPEKGGHQYGCTNCGHQHFAWHSCNHRMCPNCGSEQTRKWVRNRIDNTLNVTHFMLTFTLPSQLKHLCSSAPDVFYREFFRCCAQAIKDILADPKHAGIESGFFGVLQSWQQNMLVHPHLHFVVPAVGLDAHGRIRKIAKNGWLVYGEVFSSRLKTLLLNALLEQELIGHALAFELREITWNCDVKNFGNALNAIKYLGTYLFKGPITNARILNIQNDLITFTVKDRKTGKTIPVSLPPVEFIRRYLLHVFPQGFHRVRYFGFMHPSSKKKLKRIHEEIGVFEYFDQYFNIIEPLIERQKNSYSCPFCKIPMTQQGTAPRAPPDHDLIRLIYSSFYRQYA